jgi:hypothetical protein
VPRLINYHKLLWFVNRFSRVNVNDLLNIYVCVTLVRIKKSIPLDSFRVTFQDEPLPLPKEGGGKEEGLAPLLDAPILSLPDIAHWDMMII